MSNQPEAATAQRQNGSHNGSAPNGSAPQGTQHSEEQGPRKLNNVLADLAKPIPQRHLRTKKKGGAQISFSPWYRVSKIMDHYTRGFWDGQVTNVSTTEDRIIVTYSITIHGKEGSLTRQATGTELLEVSYGDPSSNAEAQAFKRACARFGLGLHLYEKED